MKRIATAIAVTMLALCTTLPYGGLGEDMPTEHVQPSLWSLAPDREMPEKALVLVIGNETWQAQAAVCAVPAFIGRADATPLLFATEGSEDTVPFPHDTAKVTKFGDGAKEASLEIALEYWGTSKLAIRVHTYEETLRAAPVASYLGAPMLVDPDEAALTDLGVETTVDIGMGWGGDGTSMISLPTKGDVWRFQAELLESKGDPCNYIIVTNPTDSTDDLGPNVKWPFLSPASAMLAAHHHAFVLAEDWSADRTAVDRLVKATGKDEANYTTVLGACERLKNATFELGSYLLGRGQSPEYLAAVGGPYEVPDYFYDIHADYYYPTNGHQATHYPSSLAAYATLDDEVAGDRYSQEDMAAGRIAAASLLDACMLVEKAAYYDEFLPGGAYSGLASGGWEGRSTVVDGHRLNQPEPFNLQWDPNEPYFPYERVGPAFDDGGFSHEYLLVGNTSDPADDNMSVVDCLKEAAKGSLLHLMPHGGVDSLRIEVGKNSTGAGQSEYLASSTIRELDISAPTVVYATCCKGGAYMQDQGYEPSSFVPPAFVHAGAVAYIATPTTQSSCFSEVAPHGVGTEQAALFWEKEMAGGVPIGKALRDSKWEARNIWQTDTASPDPVHECDSLTYTLWGDPALVPYIPAHPQDALGKLDVQVNATFDPDANELAIEVTVRDLATGDLVDDAHVAIAYGGVTMDGSSAVIAVDDGGVQGNLTASVSAPGHQAVTARYSLVFSDDEEGQSSDSDILMPTVIVLATVVAIVLVVIGVRMAQPARRDDSTAAKATAKDKSGKGPAKSQEKKRQGVTK